MKLTLAFIAATSATQITFKQPTATSVGDCILEYVNGDLVPDCTITPVKANADALDAHRIQMTAVVSSIANTVCPHHIEPSQELSASGSYEHFNWVNNMDGSVNSESPNSAFCRYDCKTGHHNSDGTGACIECTTSCSPGYKLGGTCDNGSDRTCTQDAAFCPATVDFSGASAMPDSANRAFGITKVMTCAPGYTAVGTPTISCGADGQWISSGSCRIETGTGLGQWQTSRMVKLNTCAESVVVSCPTDHYAVGGGMLNNGITNAAKSVFGHSYPHGDSQWKCQLGNRQTLGGALDCGNLACQVSCVPKASTIVQTVNREYLVNQHEASGGENVKHAAGDTNFAQDGTVKTTCPSGYTVTGVGMVNHGVIHGVHSRNTFEEVSYFGNGAKCNMGKGGVGEEPEFTCYAKCAKAVKGTYDCKTITSEAGRSHVASCTRPHDEVVGGGIKQTLETGQMNWNQVTLSEKSVACQTGQTSGESVCQARCCHVTA